MEADIPDALFESTAALFALLAVPLRLRIVCHLLDGERCVGDLTRCVGVGQSTLSRHLAMLFRGGVLARRRDGTQVFYRVADARVRALRSSVCITAAGCQALPRSTSEEVS